MVNFFISKAVILMLSDTTEPLFEYYGYEKEIWTGYHLNMKFTQLDLNKLWFGQKQLPSCFLFSEAEELWPTFRY